MTTGKTIALTRWTFVGKVMSLLFNVLSRLVIAFLPRSKCLFIFMAAVTVHSDFGPPKIKSVTVSTFSPSIYHEVMGPDASQKPEHFSFCQCSEILFNTLSVLIYLLLVKVSLYLHRLNPKDVADVGVRVAQLSHVLLRMSAGGLVEGAHSCSQAIKRRGNCVLDFILFSLVCVWCCAKILTFFLYFFSFRESNLIWF